MKIKKLINILQKMDGERLVVVSKDAEGNGYHPLRRVDDDYNYDVREEKVGLASLTDEDIAAGYCEEDTLPDGEPCVVFWP
jgi:hypothetical protein